MARPPMDKALVIEDLRKKYADGPEALKGVNLEVNNGDFFALLGPNGAGKSTLIGILTGLVQKTSGKVEVYGYDLDTEVSKVKASLGVVPQEFNFNAFETVMNSLLPGRILRNTPLRSEPESRETFEIACSVGKARPAGTKPLRGHETQAHACQGAGQRAPAPDLR